MLTPQQRAAAVKSTIDFFETEREEKIGVLAAEKLLDHFLSIAAEQIYEKAIEDARKLVKKRSEDLDLILLLGK